MPFDGITTYMLARDLDEKLTGGRIDKIYQPEADQVVLNIRSGGRLWHLLLSAGAGSARFQLTEKKVETPLSPPMFCMFLRKHLNGGKIVQLRQVGFDRILVIEVEAMDELGDLTRKSLILEIMGKHSNLILVDQDLVILDSIRRVSPFMSSVRQIGPGLVYEWPMHNHKADPMAYAEEAVLEGEQVRRMEDIFGSTADPAAAGPLVKALYTVFNGLSPLASREILYRARIDEKETFADLSPEKRTALAGALTSLMGEVRGWTGPHWLYYKEEGDILDFSLVRYESLEGIPSKEYEDLTLLLDDYFDRSDRKDILKQKAQDLRHILNNNLSRVRRKLLLQEKQLEDTLDREQDRIRGDLITANVYQLKQGMNVCELPNYYEDGMPPLTISLDVNLTPAQNAQRYYARYNKKKRTEEALTIQMEEGREEEAYLLSVLSSLDLSDCEQDLTDIRTELSANGYLRRMQKGKKNLNRSKPMEFTTSEGVRGLIGKNNIQNDQLTFRTARPKDEWFHVKNIPGSHVILLVQDLVMGRDYTEKSLLEAAVQAAAHSSGREGTNVPVDHTRQMYVKKPAGSRPGFVRYTHEQTIFVPADEIGKVLGTAR